MVVELLSPRTVVSIWKSQCLTIHICLKKVVSILCGLLTTPWASPSRYFGGQGFFNFFFNADFLISGWRTSLLLAVLTNYY